MATPLRRLLIAWITLQLSLAARAADIHVMSGGAPREALAILIPRFERVTGHHIIMTYDVISSLQRRLADGALPDVVLMPLPSIVDLVKAERLQERGRMTIGTVKLVAIVGKGQPLPDISTPDTFRNTLLAARSIVVSTPSATPSGAHMARIVSQLGIADEIHGKIIYRPALEGGASMVARGEAEIGVYPSSEVMHVDGVVQAGALPAALQLGITYGAAVAPNVALDPPLAFIRFLTATDNKQVWKDAGFDPS